VSETVLPVLDIRRDALRWEDHLAALTPVEEWGGVWFKRDDRFAPLGIGGINGAKLRQCTWLVNRARLRGATGLISAASVKSPQLSMSAAVALHYGLPSIQVIGATTAAPAMRHENVAMAAWFGSRFAILPVAYNPNLQRGAERLKGESEQAGYYWLPYGIGSGHGDEDDAEVEAFHAVGAAQAENIPPHIETIVLPFGSGNSAASVLYGIARRPPPALREVVLVGIGPSRRDWLEERLALLESVSGVETRRYGAGSAPGDFRLTHYDLHGTGWVRYQDEMPHKHAGLELHPTYEGKVFRYIAEARPELLSETSLFWIVGGPGRREAMMPVLRPILGDPPAEMRTVAAPRPREAVRRPRADEPVPGRASELPGGAPEVSDLVAGLDFRRPEYRREVFLRFYEFHSRHRAHPGGVYYLIPWLAERYGWDIEQKLWFAFLNGCSQHPITTRLLIEQVPDPRAWDRARFERWYSGVYERLGWDTDRRYFKTRLPDCIDSYRKWLAGTEQAERFAAVIGGSEPREAFRRVWAAVMRFPYFGRLSSFSYLEYLRLAGLDIECGDLFLRDMKGSMSHRNGLCIVLGRDDLDWHRSNPRFDGHYGEAVLEWLEAEAEALLAEAEARFGAVLPHVGNFTLESTLCCYKGWHRPRRRYPNVYNDMLYDRLKAAERHGWGVDDFWQARRECLPDYLRREDCPRDVGLTAPKQDHYRLTGQVIMMDRDDPVFANDYNDWARS